MGISCVKGSKVTGWVTALVAAAVLAGFSSAGAAVQSGEDLFTQGNQAYAEGRYDDAIGYYDQVIAEAGFSASVLYNVANAYYQKKNVGQAILPTHQAVMPR